MKNRPPAPKRFIYSDYYKSMNPDTIAHPPYRDTSPAETMEYLENYPDADEWNRRHIEHSLQPQPKGSITRETRTARGRRSPVSQTRPPTRQQEQAETHRNRLASLLRHH